MKIAKKIGKISLIVLLSLIGLLVLVWGGLNLAKFGIYAEYYSIKTDVCDNPGLNDGFVCQGITYVEEEEKILVSGYMTNDSASRIYVTDKQDNSYYVTIKKTNGNDFTGHAGGIAYCGDTVYVANGNAVHILSLADILTAKDGGSVTIASKVTVNNAASFIYADETYLYVGEFHDGGKYNIQGHEFNGNHAIVERFAIATFPSSGEGTPDRIYSIPNKVQGFCVTPDGKMIMSTSYGLTDSHYYVYGEADAYESGETFNGTSVYYLGDCKRDVKGPAMAEGLDYMDGKVITLTESASNKYIFGKLFFANQIVGLQF
ncbi:MAG: hypothetical protein IJY11_01580 [Clostridia bacterium]|nr:hypothetical protein [Clostridia bacterium]